MKFLLRNVQIIDRHTEDVSLPDITTPKHERATLQIELVSSGDTTKFTNKELVSVIMEKLKEIEPN